MTNTKHDKRCPPQTREDFWLPQDPPLVSDGDGRGMGGGSDRSGAMQGEPARSEGRVSLQEGHKE